MRCYHCDNGTWRFTRYSGRQQYWHCDSCASGSVLLHCSACEQLTVRPSAAESEHADVNAWECTRCRITLGRCPYCRRVGLTDQATDNKCRQCPHCHRVVDTSKAQ